MHIRFSTHRINTVKCQHITFVYFIACGIKMPRKHADGIRINFKPICTMQRAIGVYPIEDADTSILQVVQVTNQPFMRGMLSFPTIFYYSHKRMDSVSETI